MHSTTPCLVTPPNTKPFWLKGTIEVQDRAYKTAIDTFVSGLRYYPRDDVFMYKLSEAYRGLGDKAKAEEMVPEKSRVH